MMKLLPVLFVHVFKNCTEILCLKHFFMIRLTGPSYQNESSDSVARKPLDEFQNTFNTK